MRFSVYTWNGYIYKGFIAFQTVQYCLLLSRNLRTCLDNKAFENDRAPFQLRLLMKSNKIDNFFLTFFFSSRLTGMTLLLKYCLLGRRVIKIRLKFATPREAKKRHVFCRACFSVRICKILRGCLEKKIKTTQSFLRYFITFEIPTPTMQGRC